MRSLGFWGLIVAALLAGGAFATLTNTEYYFIAAYAILQALIMAIAWNILGGFTGYVNFGSAGFFALAAYSSVALHKFLPSMGFDKILSSIGIDPLLVYIAAGAVLCGLIGLGTGYLTLRLRGVYFAIATLALAIVFQTFMNNWSYVGAAKGTSMSTPDPPQFFGGYLSFTSYAKYLFVVMLLLSLTAIVISRYIVHSKFGRGLAAIRDDELAAECMGVPTLRLKLISATIMGALMGVAGAPYPFYGSFVDPASVFSLEVAVNAIAMPMIGGTAFWYGPVLGALLLGTAQQIISVTISSEHNVLLVGIILVAFVIMAPRGIAGLVLEFLAKAAPSHVTWQAAGLIAIASYSFIASMVAMIIGMAAVTTALASANAAATVIAISVIVLGCLLFAVACGLLQLAGWAWLLSMPTLVAFAFLLWRFNLGIGFQALLIVITVSACVLLLTPKVRWLYAQPKVGTAPS